MSRIRKAYEDRFRVLLARLRARRPEQGVRWLLTRAESLGQRDGISPAAALTRVHRELLRKTGRRLAQPARHSTALFLCDAGLGGLARWLRAAGHEAEWIPDIGDDELLRRARDRHAVVLTTDSLLMERRLLRDGVIPAVWLPPTLKIVEQMALLFSEMGLRVRAARCMGCGGELRAVEKEAMRDRIPPKTWLWKDEYFVCVKCGRLFWHGTHWRNISRRLETLQLSAASQGAVGGSTKIWPCIPGWCIEQ